MCGISGLVSKKTFNPSVLKSINDLVEIGFEEYINSGSYCFIEWPEIADSFFLDKYININISINSKNSRDIDITFH